MRFAAGVVCMSVRPHFLQPQSAVLPPAWESLAVLILRIALD